MTARVQSLLVALAVLVYCGWQSWSLKVNWFNAPFNRLGWLAFLIWLAPLLVEIFLRGKIEPVPIFLWIGLALTLLGTLGDRNAPCYVGLACAIAAFTPWKWMWRLLWLAASVTWMTAFGYFAQRASLSPATVSALRIIIVSLVSGWILFCARRRMGAQP